MTAVSKLIETESYFSFDFIHTCYCIGYCLLFLRKKNRNLLKVKQSLAEQNRRLQEMTGNLTRMNEEIKESNHIKEEYIGLLFNICSEYIYKQENDRKSLLKIVNTGSMADISKMLHNQSSTTEDFKLFISKFDTIFLSIFRILWNRSMLC